MPRSTQLDTLELGVNLPYDTLTPELDDRPRFVDGDDMWVTQAGKLRLRPALRWGSMEFALAANHRVKVLVPYQSLDGKRYLLASAEFVTNGFHAVFYLRLGDASPAWTLITALRSVHTSLEPHEIVVANGLAYIKSFPGSAPGEKLASVIFDGTDASTTIWGLLPPTVAAEPTSSSWPASTNPTTVRSGWLYAYSWKTASGHISSRSPVATPTGTGSDSPSSTGAFTNQTPVVNVQGHSDTTNVTDVVIWRTTDGGGTFMKIDETTNTGSGTIAYTDNQRGDTSSGDPKTDFEITAGSNFAPSGTLNDPPPVVVAPEVTGVDTPKTTTNMVTFSKRIWYGIENILFFSGYEEIPTGSPWESFPSGTYGNFETYHDSIRGLAATDQALYVITESSVTWIRGSDRATFYPATVTDQIGGADFRRAYATFGDSVVFMTSEGQIALVQGKQLQIISGPIENDLTTHLANADEVIITPHYARQKAWIVVTLADHGTPSNGRTFVYDANRGAWNPPWHLDATATASGRLVETGTAAREMIVATWDGSQARIGVLADTHAQDQLQATPAAFDASVTLPLVRVPAGNHVNGLRKPLTVPRVDYIVTERTKFSSDTAPTIEYRLNEFNGAWTAPDRVDPPYEDQSSSYNMDYHAVLENAYRAQVKISKDATNELVELQNLKLAWHPQAGQ